MVDIGNNIRKKRMEKGLGVNEMANITGFSPGYISQIERNIANPSINSLKVISNTLGVPLASFFIEEGNHTVDDEDEYVVRKNKRKKMVNPKLKTEISLLSPNFQSQLELIMIVAEKDGGSGDDFHSHEGEECGIMLKGALTIEMIDKKFTLYEGDSITFKSSTPHKWYNPGEETSISIWAITPPSF